MLRFVVHVLTFGEVCFSDDPFETLIRERRQQQARILKRGEGTTSPYVAVPAKLSR